MKPALLLPLCIFAIYAFARTETIYIESFPNPEVTDITSKLEITSLDKDETYFFPLPTITKVSSKYGKKGSGFHKGYDMRGVGRDTIYAMKNGIVTRSNYDKAWGNAVFLKHDDNLESIYAHNSVNLVKEGDRVGGGQPIAIIGNTGKSTGEHLHFEVRQNGESINAFTKFKFFSTKSLEGIIPPPAPPLNADNVRRRDSVKSSVEKIWYSQNYSTEKERIGESAEGHFKIMSFSYTGEPENTRYSTVFPASYNKNNDGNEKKYLRIHYYVIDGKKYLRNSFLDKYRNGKVFLQKYKIQPEDGAIAEVQGITTDGVKTPVFYMTMKNKKI